MARFPTGMLTVDAAQNKQPLISQLGDAEVQRQWKARGLGFDLPFSVGHCADSSCWANLLRWTLAKGSNGSSPTLCWVRGWPGYVTRGDKTAIELFIAGVRGWEAGLQRIFSRNQGNGS